jgi:disulfide bond formation protein DsbB
MLFQVEQKLARFMNLIGLLIVIALSLGAFVDQIVAGDIPCPLCMLQRFGFLAIAYGFL